MLSKKKNNKGFTLVELLVVIAIIGILAVVAVPALFKNIEKGKIADLEADISAIRSAALSVYADTSALPVSTPSSTGMANDNINAELEGLSYPFKGTYELALDSSTPKDLVLNIDLSSTANGKKISANGAKKLSQDLSNITLYKEGNTVANGTTDDVTKITIKILDVQ